MTIAAGVMAAAMMGATGAAQADDWSTVTDATPWGDIGATVAVSPPKVAFLVPFIAQAEGFFDKEHLHVHLVPETSGVPAFLSTVSGSTKFAFTSATDPIIAASHGKVARVIWSYGMKLDTVCIGGKGIKKAGDLKGKNVGVTDTGGFAQTLLQACLAPDNVDMKSVKQINMHRSGFVPAMVTNRISAAIFHADGAYTILDKMPNDTTVLAYESKTLPLWWYGARSEALPARADPGQPLDAGPGQQGQGHRRRRQGQRRGSQGGRLCLRPDDPEQDLAEERRPADQGVLQLHRGQAPGLQADRRDPVL